MTSVMLCCALFVLLCGESVAALTKNRHPLSRTARFAIQAIDRLDTEFLDSATGLYGVTGDKYGPTAALWPTSQVLAGAIGVARLTGASNDLERVRRILASLRNYASPGGGFRVGVRLWRRYYDDNNWIALDMLDAYDLLHDASLIRDAEQVFSFIISGWDPVGGGIHWATDRMDRPTAATAPAITVAARLALLTGKAKYRDWAYRLLNWEVTRMRDPTGLYWDHIRENGTVDRAIVSYNQGVMIQAFLELRRLTGDTTYLASAMQLAKLSAQALAGRRHNRGRFAAYDAIYYQAVRNLGGLSPQPTAMQQAQDFIAWAQSFALSPRAANQRDEEGLIEQAAIVITAAAISR